MKYLLYQIELKEPVKISGAGNWTNNEEIMTYIPGSAVRGAVISQLLQERKDCLLHEDETLKRRFLEGKVSFSHLYPTADGQRAMPLPAGLYTSKAAVKGFSTQESIPMVFGQAAAAQQETQQGAVKGAEFVCPGDDPTLLEVVPVAVQAQMHVNKQADKLFRYEALERGQVFAGYITFSPEEEGYEAEMTQWLEDRVFYIGGSKGSGYGQCQVVKVTSTEHCPEKSSQELPNEWQNGEFYLVLTSDLVYRSRSGDMVEKPDEDVVAEALGVESVQLLESYLQTRDVESFNQKWQTRTPGYRSVKAGGVYRYGFTGTLTSQAVDKFMENGLGQGVEEGYGRCMVLKEMPFARLQKSVNRQRAAVKTQDLSTDDQQLLQLIGGAVLNNKLRMEKEKQVQDLSRGFRASKGKTSLKTSQLGNLMQVIARAQGMAPEKGKVLVTDYLDNLKEKQHTTTAYKQLLDSRVDGKRLTDFITDFIRQADEEASFLLTKPESIKKLVQKGWVQQTGNSFIWQYQMDVLESFLRNALRRLAKEGK